MSQAAAQDGHDFVIRGATVVDGTGAAPFVGDVGIRAGRIDFVRRADQAEPDTRGRESLDASGLVLTPGFVDPHTHYDAIMSGRVEHPAVWLMRLWAEGRDRR